ncbi:MAG: hypothetical protein HY744_15985 [Deltaproteobacteria bacterium]|nr:hypothetical protein [Deltaproteobacteria bacterium]
MRCAWRFWLWPALLGLIVAPSVSHCAKGASSETAPEGAGGAATTGTGAAGAGAAAGAAGEGGAAGGGGQGGAGGEGGSAVCVEEPCKLVVPQCGCPKGEKCTVNKVEAKRVCQPIDPKPVGWAEQCTVDTCDAGFMCLKTGVGSKLTCHKFCAADEDCAPPGGLCVIQLQAFSKPIEGAKVCTVNCDPITNTGCKVEGMKCDIAQEPDPPNRWLTDCTGSGSKKQGESCFGSNQCAPGIGCFTLTKPDNSKETLCLTYCSVKNPSCPNGTSCGSFQTPIQIGSIEYGACVPDI